MENLLVKREYRITSLFSGCGGFDLGFHGGFRFLGKNYDNLRFNTIFANDIDRNACKTFQENLKIPITLSDINSLDIRYLDKSEVVIGGFPCQDFSVSGKRMGLNGLRGFLYKNMVEVVDYLKPSIFVAENVRGILSMSGGSTFRAILDEFSSIGYNVSYRLLKVSDFGVPQKRERVIIVGTRAENLPYYDFDSLSKGHTVSSYEALVDLEDLKEGSVPNHFWSKAKLNNGQGNTIINPGDFAPTMRAEHHGNIEFHYNGNRRLSAREAARIQSFPDDFIFYPSTSSAYKQIGNAVPPVFAWSIASSIQNFLDQNLV